MDSPQIYNAERTSGLVPVDDKPFIQSLAVPPAPAAPFMPESLGFLPEPEVRIPDSPAAGGQLAADILLEVRQTEEGVLPPGNLPEPSIADNNADTSPLTRKAFVPARKTVEFPTQPVRIAAAADGPAEQDLPVKRPASGSGIATASPARAVSKLDPGSELSTSKAGVSTGLGAPVGSGTSSARQNDADAFADAATDSNNSKGDITALFNNTLSVPLEGRGWIYTGAGTGAGSQQITLLSRKITADETIFEFEAASPGRYLLEFQLQDNASGVQRRQTVPVVMAGDLETAAAAADGEATNAESSESGSAIAAFEPAVPETIEQALGNPAGAAAVLGKLLVLMTPQRRNELDALTGWYRDAGYTKEYARCLERYLEIFPDGRDNDFRYYELGRLYETEELRNEKKARTYYAAVVELYPASLYYFDAANRVHYLDRYFIDVR